MADFNIILFNKILAYLLVAFIYHPFTTLSTLCNSLTNLYLLSLANSCHFLSKFVHPFTALSSLFLGLSCACVSKKISFHLMQEQSHPEFVYFFIWTFFKYIHNRIRLFVNPNIFVFVKKKNLSQILKLADFLIIINQIQ